MTLFWVIVALVLVCAGEGAIIYAAVKRARTLQQSLSAAVAAATAAKQELTKLADLMKNRDKTEGEARDEKQKLEATTDSGLVDRADALFS